VHFVNRSGCALDSGSGWPGFFAYSTNYLIELDGGIIVDVEATPAYRTDEVNATQTMIERVEERFDVKPQRLVGIPRMGLGPCSVGWSRISTSHRIFRSGINRNATTAHSLVQTLPLTLTITAINVLAVNDGE
jgi:hypothetical protein